MVDLNDLDFELFTSGQQLPTPPRTASGESSEHRSSGSDSGYTSSSSSSASSSLSSERSRVIQPVERPMLQTPSKYGRVTHTIETNADLAALFRAYIRALNTKAFATLHLCLSPTCTINGAPWNSEIIMDMISPIQTLHSSGAIVTLTADMRLRVIATRIQFSYRSVVSIVEYDNLFFRFNDEWRIEEIRGNLPWRERVEHALQIQRNRRQHRVLGSTRQLIQQIDPAPQALPPVTDAELTPPM